MAKLATVTSPLDNKNNILNSMVVIKGDILMIRSVSGASLPSSITCRLYRFKDLTQEICTESLMSMRTLPGSQLLPLSSHQSRDNLLFIHWDISVSVAWVSASVILLPPQ